MKEALAIACLLWGCEMSIGIGAPGVSGPFGGPRRLRGTVLSRVTLRAALNLPAEVGGGTRVRWQNAVGVSVSGNSITKTAAGGAFDAGASSVQTLWSGDGYVEFTTLGNNKTKLAGLSNGDPGQTDTEIDFAIRLGNTGSVGIRENGVQVAGGPVGTYVAGDVFRVGVENGEVVYRQNGALLYVSTTAPTYPLLVDASLFHLGATISRAVLASPPLYPVRWTEAGGVTVQGNKLTKTAPTGWGNAGAVSVQRLTSGDGFVEVIAEEPTTSRMFGLGTGNASTDYGDINFALALVPGAPGSGLGELSIYESGVWKADPGAFAPGDRLSVGVENGAVKYRQNGTLLYTSATAPTYPLLVDTALESLGATLLARVSGMRIHTMHEIDADLGEWGWSPLSQDLLTS